MLLLCCCYASAMLFQSCFYQVFTWICPICYKGVCKKCYLDLLKLLCIPRSLQNKTKLNFNQYSKDCWSFCFELMVLIESKRSMPLVHCAFGIVRQGSCLINDEQCSLNAVEVWIIAKSWILSWHWQQYCKKVSDWLLRWLSATEGFLPLLRLSDHNLNVQILKWNVICLHLAAQATSSVCFCVKIVKSSTQVDNNEHMSRIMMMTKIVGKSLSSLVAQLCS